MSPAAKDSPGSGQAGAHMLREMAEQPSVLERLLERRTDLHAAITDACPDSLRGIILLARGSSDHAALFGRYVLETAVERPVTLGAPSLWTRYGLEEDLAGYLAIGMSQSGQTSEIATTLDRMQGCGAATVAITNDAGSPLAASAQLTLDLAAGAELAVPATKTVTAQLAMLALVAEALGGRPWSDQAWRAVVDAQRAVVDDAAAAAPAAGLVARSRSTVHISRGHSLAVAHESALKMAECTGIPSVPYAAPDFLHGPLATAAADVVVIAYGTHGPTYEDIKAAARKAQEAGSPVISVGAGDGASEFRVATSTHLPEPLAPLVLVPRGQQLAYHAAMALGLNPDAPIGLTKVTHTT